MKIRLISISLLLLIASSLSAETLEQLSKIAIERNLKVKISQLEIEQSLLDLKNSEIQMIPDVSLALNKSHKTFKDQYQKSNPYSFDSTIAYSLKLTQSYPGLGNIPWLKKEIAQLKKQAKETSLKSAEVKLLRDLTKTFFKLVKEQELAKIHKTDLLLIKELLKVAKLNLEVGLVLKSDILRIEVEQLNSEASLVESENNYSNLLVDMANLLNMDNLGSLTVALPSSLKFSPLEFSVEDSLKQVMSKDLELKLANTDSQILRKAEKMSRSAYLPTLSFDSTYNYGRKMGPIEGTKDISATFILSTPVYDSGEIENGIRMAQKSRKINDLRIDDLKNKKKSELEKAISNYQEAIKRKAFAEKAVEHSYENMRIVFSRYQEGDASIVELVDAQRIITNSAQTAIKAYYDERERVTEIILQTLQLEKIKDLDQNPSPLNVDLLLKSLNLGEAK